MSLGSIYLRNLAERAIRGDKINHAELVRCPKVIDKVYGDGNGVLDYHDIDDIAINVASEAAEKFEHTWDFFTSLFDF